MARLIGIIMVLASSQGHVINFSQLKSLTKYGTGCIVKQQYNPHTFISDFSCDRIWDSIDHQIAARLGERH